MNGFVNILGNLLMFYKSISDLIHNAQNHKPTYETCAGFCEKLPKLHKFY